MEATHKGSVEGGGEQGIQGGGGHDGTRKDQASTVMRRRMRGRGQVSGPADITCSAVMHLMTHLLPS